MNRSLAPILCSLGFLGCTSFADVRSAEVRPGLQVDGGITVSAPPGDAAAWFWTLDCASHCDHAIISPNVAIRHGRVPQSGGRPYELGAGISGMFPYATGYLQLARGPRPVGVGARVGIPFTTWREDAIFARYDLSSGSTRVVLAPTVFLHSGSSPNGGNRGWFLAFAPALGLQHERSGVSVTTSLAPVLGHTKRSRSLGREVISGSAAFLVAGLSLSFAGAR
jgi:hypothetical protein